MLPVVMLHASSVGRLYLPKGAMQMRTFSTKSKYGLHTKGKVSLGTYSKVVVGERNNGRTNKNYFYPRKVQEGLGVTDSDGSLGDSGPASRYLQGYLQASVDN